jgi:hypothetical protein
MKNISIFFIILLISTAAIAKKVKFAVDLSGLTVNPLGVHVAGNFQVLAGFGTDDWISNTTPLSQEGSSNIYSIIVDIPAFASYEFKFINGDQWYDSEFVPQESRVENPINDNRWIYVDSTANDTTYSGAILFGGNAPLGKFLLRFSVDLQNETVSSAAVHVAGDFTTTPWIPTANRMYNHKNKVFELIAYVDSASYQYKFYNGNTANSSEIVPAACANNGNRNILVQKDTVIDIVCYSQCTACSNGIKTNQNESALKIYPNPANSYTTISLSENTTINTISLFNITGSLICKFDKINQSVFKLEKNNLPSGLYFVKIQTENQTVTKQLLFN